MAEARDRRDRGQALLRAPRHRRARHRARALGRHHAPAAPSRAARRSRSSSSRTRYTANAPTLGAQAPRGGARLAARAAVVEGPDPDRVPEHDLLRQRRLRRRAGLPHLLRPQRRRRDSPRRRRCSPGSPRTRASTTRSRTRRRRARGAISCSCRCTSRATSTRGSTDSTSLTPMPKPRTCSSRRRQSAGGAVLRELRRRTSSSTSYGPKQRLRRRAARDDDDRPEPAEARARGDREGAAARRSARPRRSSRSTRGPAPCSRWSAAATTTRASSTSRPRASGSPGSSFKPFVLAAALKEGIAPSTMLTSQHGDDRRRRTALAGEQLRGRGPRPDRPHEGDRVLRQHGLRAADERRRAREASRRRRRTSGSRPRCSRTSRSGSAPSRRRRSRWRAPTRAFANGGYRIDGSIFGNEPRAIECVEGRRHDCRQNTPVGQPALGSAEHEPGGGDHRLSCSQGVVQLRHRHRGRRSPGRTGRRQDRHDRELRRRVVRRLHARSS